MPIRVPDTITAAWLNGLSEKERGEFLQGAWSRLMHARALSHVTYLFWNRRSLLGTLATNNGSAFFVDTGSRIFGVTAEHVVQGYLNDKEKAPRHIICQLGTIEAPFDLEGRLVGRGTSAIDIATFEVTRDELAALDKQAITLPELSLPAPTPEGAVFIVGFPGSRRLWLGRKTLSFGTFGWCGPLTRATSTQLSVAFEREFWVPTDASSGPAPKLRLGGLSGGPMLAPLEHRGS